MENNNELQFNIKFTSAILVPGGGLDKNGTPHPWVKERLNKALEIVQNDTVVVVLSRYSTHKPPIIDNQGMPLSESKASARYLIQRGLPCNQIRVEDLSYDTIGNFYFTKVLFLDVLEIDRVVIINSDFHIPRTKAIADWILNFERTKYRQIKYLNTPNTGLNGKILSARISMEKQKLNKLEKLRRRIKSEQEFHTWLFTEHEAYSPAEKITRHDEALLLSTY